MIQVLLIEQLSLCEKKRGTDELFQELTNYFNDKSDHNFKSLLMNEILISTIRLKTLIILLEILSMMFIIVVILLFAKEIS